MTDSVSAPTERRVLSGMRPTGKLHLGNYMGALHNWVRLQESYECFFFIADLHALTTDYANTAQIKQNTLDVALDFLAAGLDPERCTIFVQSHVRQHAELHLLLSMLTPLGWLERIPTYKEQLENLRGKDLATYGFLGYPLLQSADILLYRPQYVPVGLDQVSHIELTREVARRFNSIYKSAILREPEALLTPTPKLPGLDGRKMSKSYGNVIGLSEHPALNVQKLQGMSTNGQRIQQTDPGDPDLCPVGDMHKVFSPAERLEDILKGCRTASIPCVWCKYKAAESITTITEPIYNKRQKLERNIDQTWEMLLAQADKAAVVAEETLEVVRGALNITRDLGAARRSFGCSEADKERLRDLSQYAGQFELPSDQTEKWLREYWQTNILGQHGILLSAEPNKHFQSIVRELQQPLLTRKKKRVLVVAGRPFAGFEEWSFIVPLKTYEVWALVIWDRDYMLEDFVIPQKYFAGALSEAKKTGSGGGFEVRLRRADDSFTMQIAANNPIDITELRRGYAVFS